MPIEGNLQLKLNYYGQIVLTVIFYYYPNLVVSGTMLYSGHRIYISGTVVYKERHGFDVQAAGA